MSYTHHRLTSDLAVSHSSDDPGEDRQAAVPVALHEVSKRYRHSQSAVRALDNVSAEFTRHSFTAVMRPPAVWASAAVHSPAD